MKYSPDELRERLQRNPSLARLNPELFGNNGDQRTRPHPVSEKLVPRDRGPKKPRVEKESDGAFRVTVTLKFADERVRDSDAAISSIFDCIIAARRSLENYLRNPHLLSESSKR